MSKDLISQYGIKGALDKLKSKLPNGYIPKVLRNKKEYLELNSAIKEIESLCPHEQTRNECIDYHRRDFGTICKACGSILNTNG